MQTGQHSEPKDFHLKALKRYKNKRQHKISSNKLATELNPLNIVLIHIHSYKNKKLAFKEDIISM